MPSNQKLLTAAAGSAGSDPLYVEDVFSTYLYTGNGTARTITNGIDIGGEGGLVWTKARTSGVSAGHILGFPGASYVLRTEASGWNWSSLSSMYTAFNSNGYSITNNNYVNETNQTFASWSFRKAKKFFDVVTFTGNATNGRQVAHNLGSVPSMIILKRTDGDTYWVVYHKSTGKGNYLFLNTNDAQSPYDSNTTNSRYWYNTAPTSTHFTVSNDGWVNYNGGTFVAYVFGEEAAFGEDEDENIVKCGTYTGAGANLNINVGFEPQFVLVKSSSNATNWVMFDTMRGLPVEGNAKDLRPNTSEAEANNSAIGITSTGFLARNGVDGQINANGYTYIYMAIRKPMKVPEAATEVFNIGTYGANRDNSSTSTYYAGFPVDMALKKVSANDNANNFISTRMLGLTDLRTNSDIAERTGETDETFDSNTHWNKAAGTSSTSYSWMWRRASGFFDVVAYTGSNNSGQNVPHNLTVIPEMMWFKPRNGSGDWIVYHKDIALNRFAFLSQNYAGGTSSGYINSTRPTDAVFTVGSEAGINGPNNFINYLFATLAGVSKVGSYTANANSTDIACGFSGTARFILIKRIDAAGDWYYWDSLRGISAAGSNDPYLLINTQSPQVTNTDYVAPYAGGFNLTTNGSSTVNVSGGTYIFLAMA